MPFDIDIIWLAQRGSEQGWERGCPCFSLWFVGEKEFADTGKKYYLCDNIMGFK